MCYKGSQNWWCWDEKVYAVYSAFKLKTSFISCGMVWF